VGAHGSVFDVRRVAGVMASAFVCCMARSVLAQPPTVTEQPLAAAIDVSPGATCLEQGRLQGEVQTWLGRARLRADLHVHVEGDESDPHAIAFRIVIAGQSRERRFDDLPAGCEDATAVVGLAIALAIDVNAVAGIVVPAAPAVPPSAPARRAFAVQAGVGFDVLPDLSLGLAAGLEYGLGAWMSLRLDLMTQFSWSNSIDGAKGVFDVLAAGALPQLCAGGNVTDSVRFELCSGVVAGFLHAQGRDFAVSNAATGPWIAAQGGVRLLFTAGIPWAMDIDGVFPIHAPAFRAQNSQGMDEYRNPSAAGALFSFGPAFPF
jgi:hypothetical protein